jgi:hypothetical protein
MRGYFPETNKSQLFLTSTSSKLQPSEAISSLFVASVVPYLMYILFHFKQSAEQNYNMLPTNIVYSRKPGTISSEKFLSMVAFSL